MSSDAPSLRSRRAAIAGAFFVQGLLFISLTLRLPLVQRTFDIDELALSGYMLLMVLLAGLGSVLAEMSARRLGSGLTLRAAMLVLATGTVIMGAALGTGDLAPFVLGLAVYGTALGGVDATCNMQAVALEHRLDRPILPSSHGAWTAGGLLATAIALTLPGLDPSRSAMAVAAAPLVVLVLPLLRHDAAPPQPATTIDVPWRAVSLVGIALVLFYMVDTASTAWGPVYLASSEVFTDPPTSSQMVALATLPYLTATMLARLAGDGLTRRFGAPAMVRTGAAVASVGLLVVVLAPAPLWPVAILGFFVTGLGVAVIAPLSFSAAAAIAGSDVDPAQRRARVDAVIARFNQFNYAGALLGAVLTGAIGGVSLRIGFTVPALLVLGMIPLARHFARPRR
ncbi:MAG: MFS transporter [Janibacter sp.]